METNDTLEKFSRGAVGVAEGQHRARLRRSGRTNHFMRKLRNATGP